MHARKGEVRTLRVPLSQRPVDVLFILWFVVYVFTVTFTDLHNFTASFLGVKVADLEFMEFPYPPKPLRDIYFLWGKTVDPLLYENPMFWQVMEWVNLLVQTPFALIAILGFVRGWNWIRNIGIIVSAFTFYSLLICFGTSFWGDNPTPDPYMFTQIYIPYLIFPVLVIVRLWGNDPFTKPQPAAVRWLLGTVASVTYAFFFTYCVLWLRYNLPHLLPAPVHALLDAVQMSLPGRF